MSRTVALLPQYYYDEVPVASTSYSISQPTLTVKVGWKGIFMDLNQFWIVAIMCYSIVSLSTSATSSFPNKPAQSLAGNYIFSPRQWKLFTAVINHITMLTLPRKTLRTTKQVSARSNSIKITLTVIQRQRERRVGVTRWRRSEHALEWWQRYEMTPLKICSKMMVTTRNYALLTASAIVSDIDYGRVGNRSLV